FDQLASIDHWPQSYCTAEHDRSRLKRLSCFQRSFRHFGQRIPDCQQVATLEGDVILAKYLASLQALLGHAYIRIQPRLGTHLPNTEAFGAVTQLKTKKEIWVDPADW